jgi:transcriptional regulator with XRE-family HTH domain
MSFGSRLVQVRKEKSMSQEELAKALNATPTTIGRYERDEVKPSVEVGAKLAATLGVSLDYLTGNSTDNPLKDKVMLERVNNLLNLNQKDRDYILFALDGLIRDAKARQTYA